MCLLRWDVNNINYYIITCYISLTTTWKRKVLKVFLKKVDFIESPNHHLNMLYFIKIFSIDENTKLSKNFPTHSLRFSPFLQLLKFLIMFIVKYLFVWNLSIKEKSLLKRYKVKMNGQVNDYILFQVNSWYSLIEFISYDGKKSWNLG